MSPISNSAAAPSAGFRPHGDAVGELWRRGRRLLLGAIAWGALGAIGTLSLDASSLVLNTNQASAMVFVYLVFGTVAVRLGNFFAARFVTSRVPERLDFGAMVAVGLFSAALVCMWLATLVVAGDMTFRYLSLPACVTAGVILLRWLALLSLALLALAVLVAVGASAWSHPTIQSGRSSIARMATESCTRLVLILAGRPLPQD